MERRQFLLGTGAVCLAAGAGCLGFFEDGPDEVAESFVEHLNEGEFEKANTLIHSESTIDGAGQAATLLAAVYGVDSVIETLDISVQDSEIIEETDDEATVAVTVVVDLIVEEAEDTIELDMRTEDGDWRVWLLG